MRAAIISAGPSAAATWHGGDYDMVIAVNQGLAICDADWLVAGDANCVLRQLGERRPRCGVFTMGDEVKNVRNLWPNSLVDRFDILPGITGLPRPFNWSIQGALAVADFFRFSHIDVYGCDMIPGPDVGGKTGDDRTADRWKRESKDLHDSVSMLRAHGRVVHRITTFPWE